MNIADYLLALGEDSQVALITDDGHQFTYGDIKLATVRMIEVFKSSGIEPSDRVGILGANSLFWVVSYLAILKLGAIAVPFSTLSMADEIKAMQSFANCKVSCVQERYFGKFGDALTNDRVPILDNCLSFPPSKSWEQIPLDIDFDEQREAALMFTSGTTQKPRAVRISHSNIRANTESIITYLNLTKADRMMVVLPFYYCFGTSLLHTHLRVGGSLVLSNSFAFPEKVLDLMQTTQCTGFAGVPSIYQTLLRNTSLPNRRMSCVKKVQQAGGKLPVVQIKELSEILPGTEIYVMYGLTEATARLSYLPPTMLDKKPGSIGKGIPGVELKVINELGNCVKPGEVGEIIAKGENISAGYLNEPECNLEKFIHGTLYTGDLATVDEDGYIYIVDRKSDFIKSYGYRVSSQQVEAIILELKDVVSAAAIGEPDSVSGEAIKVFITLREGSQLSPPEIIAHCRQRMAHHMIPKEVEIVDSLPLSAQGKVMKSELRKRT